MSRLSARTGRPETRAYSSSWQTANSAGRSTNMATRTHPPSTPMVTRSARERGQRDPKRYALSEALLASESPTSNTPPAIPP